MAVQSVTDAPIDVLVVSGEEANFVGRPSTVLSASQTPDSIFPLSRLADERAGRKWISPTLLGDDWVQAHFNSFVNGSFDTYDSITGFPLSWTATETGTGTITEEVTSPIKAGSSLQMTNGAAGNAEVEQAYLAEPGEVSEIRVSTNTSSAASPNELEIFDESTGKYLQPGAGTWSRTRRPAFTFADVTLTDQVETFTVETIVESGVATPHSIRFRLHMDNAAASVTHHWDELNVVPAVNISGVVSHNVTLALSFALSGSDEDMVDVPVPSAIRGDGSVSFERAAGFAGEADTKVGTISTWAFFSSAGTTITILNSAGVGTGFKFWRQADNTIRIRAGNAATTQILNMVSTTAYTSGWHHIYASWDLAQTTGVLVIDGVDDLAGGAQFTDDFIDYTDSGWVFMAADGLTEDWVGDLGEVWFSMGHFLPATAANLSMFRSSAGMAERLGSDGSAPTGAPPQLYVTGNDFSVNASGAGNFETTNGTPTYPVTLCDEFDAEAPTAYTQVTAAHFEYWRLWARGTNVSKFNFGEWYLAQATTLRRNPDQPGFATAIDLPQNVLSTSVVGERYNVQKDRYKRRGYSLSFQHGTTTQSDQWANEFWERSKFGGLPIFFVPNNQAGVAIMAKPSEIGFEQSQVTSEVSTVKIELREVPHGVVGS